MKIMCPPGYHHNGFMATHAKAYCFHDYIHVYVFFDFCNIVAKPVCMCICICICMYMYVCMYVCMYACMYVCMYVLTILCIDNFYRTRQFPVCFCFEEKITLKFNQLLWFLYKILY